MPERLSVWYMRWQKGSNGHGVPGAVHYRLYLWGSFLAGNTSERSKSQLLRIAAGDRGYKRTYFVGLPLEYQGKLYNAAAALNRGKIVGFVPKVNIPNYNEFMRDVIFPREKMWMERFC